MFNPISGKNEFLPPKFVGRNSISSDRSFSPGKKRRSISGFFQPPLKKFRSSSENTLTSLEVNQELEPRFLNDTFILDNDENCISPMSNFQLRFSGSHPRPPPPPPPPPPHLPPPAPKFTRPSLRKQPRNFSMGSFGNDFSFSDNFSQDQLFISTTEPPVQPKSPRVTGLNIKRKNLLMAFGDTLKDKYKQFSFKKLFKPENIKEDVKEIPVDIVDIGVEDGMHKDTRQNDLSLKELKECHTPPKLNSAPAARLPLSTIRNPFFLDEDILGSLIYLRQNDQPADLSVVSHDDIMPVQMSQLNLHL